MSMLKCFFEIGCDRSLFEGLEYYGLSEKYDVIREWYDGYRSGAVDVYCPWDVISYVNKLRVKPALPPKDFWSNTSGNDIVRKLLEKASPDMRDGMINIVKCGIAFHVRNCKVVFESA